MRDTKRNTNSLAFSQVQGASLGSSGGTSALYVYRGPLHAIWTISNHEGWRTLYKGYATISQIAPAQALYMASYQTSKRVLPGARGSLFFFSVHEHH